MSLTSEDREAIGGSIAVGYYDHTAAEKTAAVVEQIVARHVAEARAAALNEAAVDARRVADEAEMTYAESYRPYDQGVADAWDAAAEGLTTRAANPPP